MFLFLSNLSDRFGLIHQARISASVNAMRILNTGMEVEAAVADALVSMLHLLLIFVCNKSDSITAEVCRNYKPEVLTCHCLCFSFSTCLKSHQLLGDSRNKVWGFYWHITCIFSPPSSSLESIRSTLLTKVISTSPLWST